MTTTFHTLDNKAPSLGTVFTSTDGVFIITRVVAYRGLRHFGGSLAYLWEVVAEPV